MNISKTKSKKLIKKKGKKSEEKKRKINPKMNFFLALFWEETQRGKLYSTQKANMEVETCRGNKPCDL